MQGKTILFATNRLEFLTGCNSIVVMKEGSIDGQGTQAHLQETCETYQDLMATMGTVEEGMRMRLLAGVKKVCPFLALHGNSYARGIYLLGMGKRSGEDPLSWFVVFAWHT